jgi:hypothetical protein
MLATGATADRPAAQPATALAGAFQQSRAVSGKIAGLLRYDTFEDGLFRRDPAQLDGLGRPDQRGCLDRMRLFSDLVLAVGIGLVIGSALAVLLQAVPG